MVSIGTISIRDLLVAMEVNGGDLRRTGMRGIIRHAKIFAKTVDRLVVGEICVRVVLECVRCEHEWPPKGEGEPTRCPKCKSPHWNKPRQKKLAKREK